MDNLQGPPQDPTLPRSPEETPTVRVASPAAVAKQLTPGTILGDRYRIVSLLGRGGMGEVYRADDLKLGQPVALKFVSNLKGDRHQLYEEVRVGRQVTHPNVCRLHDIAEVGDQLFITMELVDGEDLASLLRRVGRFPADRGLTVAREICSGLAAAHEKGVIHRDLKPGNVMIDGRGRARITDFGLAVAGDEPVVAGGTPAYMAPEQLAGERASVQSDIYALGLTLYEVFTGRRAFVGSSLADLLARQRALDLTRPTTLVRDLDPAIERVISRCLEPDPAKRPLSVEEVLHTLPGGDALSAAVAAGETPSPEMVAAAAERGALSPGVAWSLLAVFLLALLTFALLTPRVMLHGRTAMFKPPPVLEEHARAVLEATGHKLARGDSASLLLADLSQPASDTNFMPYHFLYRQSPLPMRSLNLEQRVDWTNPPLWWSGMADVRVDSSGRLLHFTIVPPQVTNDPPARAGVDWRPFLTMAGLPANLPRIEPSWAAPVDSDEKIAWTSAGGIRVAAAAWRGRPVWFQVIRPWDRPGRMPGPASRAPAQLTNLAVGGVLAMALCAAGLLALRNLRRAQVDRRGAIRLSLFAVACCCIALALRAHHSGGAGEVVIIAKILAYSFALGGATWLGYVAVEPLLRRRWPRMLIGWSRVLVGRFQDPMVGRDLLIGLTAGMVIEVIRAATALVPGARPLLVSPSAFGQLSDTVHYFVRSLLGAAVLPLAQVAFVLACQIIVRRLPAAIVVAMLAGALGSVDMLSGPLWARVPVAVIFPVISFAILFRFGILAVAGSTFAILVFMRLPMTLDPSAWYFGRSTAGLLLLTALALYAFVTSLAGRRWLPDLVPGGHEDH